MKRIYKYSLLILCCVAFTIAPTQRSQAQILDIIEYVIQAIDVKIQKAQSAILDLQNAEKQLENELSETELGNIASWVEKQKDLYSEYFDELWKVKDAIAYYKAVTDIIAKQKQLVTEYQKAYALAGQDKNFSANELKYINRVYSGIIDQSSKSVDLINTLIQAFTVQMSDGERLKLLNRCAADIEQQISDLRRFTNQNITLSLQRAKDNQDINSVKQLYGIP